MKITPASDPSTGTTQGLLSIVPKVAEATNGNTTQIGSRTATLKGTVNAYWRDTTVFVEYGTSMSYGNIISASPSAVGGEGVHAVSAQISGLSPATTYHCRVKATHQEGTRLRGRCRLHHHR